MINKLLSKNLKEKTFKSTGLQESIEDRIRIINKDGSFNVERKGLSFLESIGVFNYFISTSWPRFLFVIFCLFILLNVLFAFIYSIIGFDSLGGLSGKSWIENFLSAFFFSTQTFTTVGYGHIVPTGLAANIVASFESLMGLLLFAFSTGLLYGRFSRPLAKIKFSENALIAPYQIVNGLQFRLANKRINHELFDVEATVVFSFMEESKGHHVRRFINLDLEYNKIFFFPSLWTVNHIIDENSPISGLSKDDMKSIDAEFLILIKGYDDTYAQTVNFRYSYKSDEIVWGAKFKNIYQYESGTKLKIDLSRVGEYEPVNMN